MILWRSSSSGNHDASMQFYQVIEHSWIEWSLKLNSDFLIFDPAHSASPKLKRLHLKPNLIARLEAV